MSDNTVRFKVQGSELSDLFSRTKANANDLTREMIANAAKESEAAKKQIQLLGEQISLLEKKNRTAAQISKLVGQGNVQQRINNIPNRDNLFDNLHRRNEERYKNKEIGQRQYETAQGRIDSLIRRNDPKNITSEYREYTKAQADALRENKLTNKLAREQVDTIRQTSRETVQAVRSGDVEITDVLERAKTPEERLSANLARETVGDDKKNKGDASGILTGITGSLITLDNLRHLIGDLTKFTQAKSGFDLIAPAADSAGRIVGTILGAVVGGLVSDGAGAMAGSAIGGELGGSVVGGAGQFIQRKALALQDYSGIKNKYLATTGADRNSFGTDSMTDYGLASRDMIALMRETARGMGTSSGAELMSKNRYFAERGYGVDQSTSGGLIDLYRSATKDSNKDLSGLIQGVLEKGKNTFFKGGDQTFLNEFLVKFTSLEKTLLNTNERVSSGTTYGILDRFNSVGGAFDSRDPRSSGLIEGINSSLINPGSDNLKAASFMALRKEMPNASLVSLLEEQQKGLGSNIYLQAMLRQVGGLGGDRDQQILNIAGSLGLKNKLYAAEEIYNKRDLLMKATSDKEVVSLLPGDLSKKAKEYTTPIERQTADISDKLLFKWDYTLDAMKDAFAGAMQEVVDGINVANVNGKLVLTNDTITANKTRTAREASKKEESERRVGSYK